jgi:hypothetical protein
MNFGDKLVLISDNCFEEKEVYNIHTVERKKNARENNEKFPTDIEEVGNFGGMWADLHLVMMRRGAICICSRSTITTNTGGGGGGQEKSTCSDLHGNELNENGQGIGRGGRRTTFRPCCWDSIGHGQVGLTK